MEKSRGCLTLIPPFFSVLIHAKSKFLGIGGRAWQSASLGRWPKMADLLGDETPAAYCHQYIEPNSVIELVSGSGFCCSFFLSLKWSKFEDMLMLMLIKELDHWQVLNGQTLWANSLVRIWPERLIQTKIFEFGAPRLFFCMSGYQRVARFLGYLLKSIAVDWFAVSYVEANLFVGIIRSALLHSTNQLN